MLIPLLLIAVLGGICSGVILGLLVQRYHYDKWFKNHCYFCCNKFNDAEDIGKTAAFETDLTENQRAHLSCWERNMFSEREWEDDASQGS